jgi:uncharacterized protein YyaL (SSP411 family)
LRLVKLTGRSDWQGRAEKTMQLYRGLLEAHPSAGGQILCALDFYLGPVQEFAIVGDPGDDETRRVLRLVHTGFRPNKVVALKLPGAPLEDDLLPLLAGKSAAGPVTTYVCANFVCQAPVMGADALEAVLREQL